MDSELLSLKWNNHRNTFLGVIKLLRNKASYTDATLACEGKFYHVHKMVLSVCSDYFSEIFENTPCKSPVIVLKDISHQSLEFLLDYMYLGEVNVKQSELSVLIKAAECLQIKGLAAPDDGPDTTSESKKNQSTDADDPPPKRRKKRHIQSSNQQPSQSVSPILIDDPLVVEIKPEPTENPLEVNSITEPSTVMVEKCDDSISIDKEEMDFNNSFQYDPGSSGVGHECEETWQDYNFGDEEDPIGGDLDPSQSEDTGVAKDKHQCKICGKLLSISSKISEHYMIHNGQRPYKCPVCSYSSTRIGNIRRHHVTLHSKFKIFRCDHCQFNTMYEDKYLKHVTVCAEILKYNSYST